MSGMRLSMRVWDLPTRLFHWLVVLLVLASYLTDQFGLEDWHFLCGYTLLALIIFRIVWGFVGSDTARFSRFLKSPVAALGHLRHFPKREPDTEIGHNAAGGWMVLVLLALLLIQIGLGLFSNDDALSQGPLAKYVDKSTSDYLSHLHALNFNILLGAIILHVLAVLGYAVVKRQNLLRPMITGRKRLPPTMRAPHMVHPLIALFVLLVAVGLVWALVSLA